MSEPSEHSEMLSVAGRERREAILRAALGVARRRRRARQAMGVAGGVAVVALAAVMFHRLPASGPQTNGPRPVARPRVAVQPPQPPVEAPEATRFATIRIVGEDATVVERLAAPAVPRLWRAIEDDELLAGVAETGMRGGLARINGETLLLARQ
jgi:hypothetical protein